MTVEERAVYGAARGEQPARAGLRTAGDEHLRFGDGVVADLERLGHVPRDGSRDDHAVGVARRGGESDAVAAEVEIDVARGSQLHLHRGVAAGRDFAQLERFGEKPADLGPHLCGVERDALLPRADDETLAHGRSDAVVVREAYRALRDAGALAAEEAAPQVEREGMRGERARGTPLRGASDGFRRLVVAGSRQDGTSPEFGGQLHGVEIRNGLPAVAA